jgi:endonuclease/exonuclease/phosphatase (EEP) superfamily protein YafD
MNRFFSMAIPILATPVAAAIGFGFLSSQFQIADSVSHFRMHLALLLVLLTGLMLVARAWRTAIAFGAVAAAGLLSLLPLTSVGMPAAKAGSREIKLFQLNAYEGNSKPQAVLVLIQRHDPDIITLQEVGGRTRMIVDTLSERYPTRIICQYRGVGDVAVLSRLPKAAGQSEGCVQREGLAWLRVEIEGRPITFASLHLSWPYPYRQHEQIDILRPHFESLKAPIVIAGDFNAAPWSNAVARIAEAASVGHVSGIRLTWGKPIPSSGPAIKLLPIDHVLMSSELAPAKMLTGRNVGSDHWPLIATFALR